MRLHVYETTHTRFALVVLRIVRFEEIGTYYGEEAAEHMINTVARRCLRLLGRGRTGLRASRRTGGLRLLDRFGQHSRRPGDNTFELMDPYDIESFAMNLGRKACEHLIDGHRAECVVGWAAAPADGLTPTT